MAELVVVTDSGCDLPLSYIEKENLATISFTYAVDDDEYRDDFGKSQDYHAFYDRMRAGAITRTAQANVSQFIELFTQLAEEGKEILYVGFSSALSGTFNSAYMAKQEVEAQLPDAKISLVDTKAASLGQGLLVMEAVRQRNAGKSREEIVAWLEANKLRMNHWFTVEDLEYLRRGGRLSHLQAAIGGILNVKPVLFVDDEGRLVPFSKVRGRKKSLSALIDQLSKRIVSPEEQVIGISHGDCLDDAEALAEEIRAKIPVKDILVHPIGPVIGAHSGPGTLAVFFYADSRS